MGNGITAEKEKEFQKEKVATIKLIHDKYAMLERRKVLIIGGPHSGKT
jgi:putative cell wall-binding protein